MTAIAQFYADYAGNGFIGCVTILETVGSVNGTPIPPLTFDESVAVEKMWETIRIQQAAISYQPAWGTAPSALAAIDVILPADKTPSQRVCGPATFTADTQYATSGDGVGVQDPQDDPIIDSSDITRTYPAFRPQITHKDSTGGYYFAPGTIFEITTANYNGDLETVDDSYAIVSVGLPDPTLDYTDTDGIETNANGEDFRIVYELSSLDLGGITVPIIVSRTERSGNSFVSPTAWPDLPPDPIITAEAYTWE